ncbi:hypothetical protein I7I48_11677 [Histoplasma ohiense]|nr:hypothetical protein I7I48_11677 [Histoplasma ohiense (nom. inval.)]
MGLTVKNVLGKIVRPLPCFRSTHRIRSVAESILLRFAARSTSWWSGFSSEILLARDEKGKLWYVSVKSHGQPRCLPVYICFLSVIVSHYAGGIASNIRVQYQAAFEFKITDPKHQLARKSQTATPRILNAIAC